MSTTPKFGFPLPPDNSLIATFPQVVRHQSEQLEDKLPEAVNDEVRGQLTTEFVRKTDEGIPYSASLEDYDEAVLNDRNQLARGILKDGTNDLPRAHVGGALHERATLPGYAKVSVDVSGRLAEDALDDEGNVPAWVLGRWAQRMGAVTSDALPPALLIVAGQSNATRRGVSDEAAAGQQTPGVYRYDPGTGTILPEVGVHWLGSGFGREWISQNPGRAIVLVECAAGGTGFWTTSLNPPPTPGGWSTTTGTWDRLFEEHTGQVDPVNYPIQYFDTSGRVPQALAATEAWAGQAAEIVGFIWSQGEADATQYRDASLYQERMDDLFNWVRGLPWAAPDMPILIGSQTPHRLTVSAPQADIDAVHMDTPRRLTQTAYQRGPEGMEENTENRTHYLPQGQEQRGAILAERVLERARQNAAAVNLTHSVMPPQRLNLRRSGDQVTARWEHPPCRITGITMETSTDGTTWAPATLSHPMAIEHTLTATGPVRVRITSTNGTTTSYPAEESI